MNPEKQRIAIAEVCGWSECRDARKVGTGQKLSNTIVGTNAALQSSGRVWKYAEIPDYLNDLNAMHEAERVLTEKQQVWYLQKLTQVRFREGVGGMIGCMIDKTTFATAAQRAEAFLRTIGKWEDS